MHEIDQRWLEHRIDRVKRYATKWQDEPANRAFWLFMLKNATEGLWGYHVT